MHQMDLFRSNTEDFLYGEIEKIKHSMDKRTRAMFAIITEMQDQLMVINEKKENDADAV